MIYFTVVNVDTATKEHFIDDIKTDFVVVSVVSPEFQEYQIPNSNFQRDILYLRFHDADSQGNVIGAFNEVKELKIIDEKQIDELLEFVEKNKNVNNWLIHCEAGISRSTGIAMALSEILNKTKVPEAYIQAKYGVKFHNVDIKRKILNRYYQQQDL